MLEFLGYIVLALTIIVCVLIVVAFQSYLAAFICFWLGLTIGAMLILNFKQG